MPTESRDSRPPPARLSHNRDFQLLWSGQVISALGSRISSIAMPLLVLGLTASPAKAGLARFAATVPILLFMLPAGAILDRLNRKRVMLACEAARALAVGSIALALWISGLTFTQILIVAVISGTGYAFFEVAHRSALRQLVPVSQLPAAAAQNQAREYTGLIAGQALGGLLFGLSRPLPFITDAVSYFVSLGTLLFIRTEFQEQRTVPPRRLHLEIAAGMAWLWRQPFLRTTALLSAGSDFVVNALYLAVIVAAQRRGASSALIGAILAFIGFGGLAPW